ncbi:hypothetical protein Sgou_47070 [Streptomyces gougerotii]|uniref:Uncharacterized protein n=2 Tax=Streptomyces TaxID=1883 RepID=A0A8H9HGR9_9ACTN|nr:hypothetical protein [Streptomyces sp. DSM 41037]NEE42081.1 hypothetical protein [Streptomyces sp. SID7982]SUP62351.1 Uncharacterised protein [Streptomyces griseus]GFH65560.1 hypothetical protein Srut_20740 [Streptomyces rutgersensis]GFH80037.1 hypothetical protein Sgou_47070 [Streptomyces gougerotii]
MEPYVPEGDADSIALFRPPGSRGEWGRTLVGGGGRALFERDSTKVRARACST